VQPFERPAAASMEIQPWELHSELMYVDPEVRRRALELLPERDPYAFLARAPSPARSEECRCCCRPVPPVPPVVETGLDDDLLSFFLITSGGSIMRATPCGEG